MNRKVLLIGYGNPGRQDDGLGPRLAEVIEKLAPEGVKVDSDYQLTVEDAQAVSEHDVAIFVDASVKGEGPFSFTRLEPKDQVSFSTHSVEPDAVMGLATQLFDAKAPGYLLGIRGYSFEMFTNEMTDQAEQNLKAAIDFIKPLLATGDFESAAQNGTKRN